MTKNHQNHILVTATWAGDLELFRLMRATLERSDLAKWPHHVIVQTEDSHLFASFRDSKNLIFHTTAEILPPSVEHMRVRARKMTDRQGRHLTRLSGSLNRLLGWPRWPAYTGWHTQQLCKLEMVNRSACETAIVIDSDVLIAPRASVADFACAEDVFCFATWQQADDISGKVRNWIDVSARLNGVALETGKPVNTNFDTPFVVDRATLRSMLEYFEQRFRKPWWEVLLRCPPRRWSEFGAYKAYLQYRSGRTVCWRPPTFSQFIYDTQDEDRLVEEVLRLYNDDAMRFITIHSQSSGKQDWSPYSYIKRLHNAVTGQSTAG